jgi:ketosteroid isomerase-like protein
VNTHLLESANDALILETTPEDTVEHAIRRRIEDYARAVSAKDIDAAMTFFAPDMVSFDLEPPLRYAGAERKRQRWLESFTAFRSIHYDVTELSIYANGDLAHVHALNHFRGTLPNGATTDTWVRWTACFRRIHGVWRVVHDHVSVPADLKHNRAMTDLSP